MIQAIGLFFSSIFSGVVALLGAKVAIRIAVSVVFFAAFSAVLLSVKGIFLGLSYTMPAFWPTVMSWVIPSNFNACLSAILATKATVWFWEWKRYYFDLLTNAV